MDERHECTVHEKGNTTGYQACEEVLNFIHVKRNGDKTIKRSFFANHIVKYTNVL